jgi:hypothetical protein
VCFADTAFGVVIVVGWGGVIFIIWSLLVGHYRLFGGKTFISWLINRTQNPEFEQRLLSTLLRNWCQKKQTENHGVKKKVS